MGDQQYVLRWNKHHENLSNGVIKYFKRELMCDVTITVGPGQKLKAHQAILSACSPYFESIFTENTHQNVTVMMVNVDHEILTAIIEYMYKGEVNIAQKLLPDFLKTAAHFQVKGLVDPENIGHNSEYDQHLTSASPPSENNISRHLESRFLNRQLIAERYDNENESDSMNKDYDSINDIENRAELSPNFDDLIRKRRKGSNCDDNSLPQKRLHRTPSESHASSHSSYKISPLPKSNSNDIETSEGKRKSPSDHANILPHQPSIKQEERESDLAVSPQVHLSSNPLNSMYTPGSGIPPPPFPQGPVDILNSVGLQHSNENENDQPISHIEPGNEIDGAEGVFIDSHHKSPPSNGNLEVFNFSSSYPMHNNSLRAKIRYSRPPVDNYAPISIMQSSMQHQVPNQIHDENTVKWASSMSSIDLGQSPEYPDRSRLPKTSLNQPMSYHNMFIPSQEPGTLWKCRLCGKEVTNRWHHFHSHTAQRSLCPYCPATYSRIDTLRMHLKQKHRREMGKASQSPFSQLPDSGIGLPLANISTSGDFCSGQNKANKIKRRRETNESQELSP
ncbi:broad-complex core protein isoforms 1/2/3/4/5 isoform X2 [Chironomus tepperi]